MSLLNLASFLYKIVVSVAILLEFYFAMLWVLLQLIIFMFFVVQVQLQNWPAISPGH